MAHGGGGGGGAISRAATFWLHILPAKVDRINPVHRKGHFVKFKNQVNKLKRITDLNVRTKTIKPLRVNPPDLGLAMVPSIQHQSDERKQIIGLH